MAEQRIFSGECRHVYRSFNPLEAPILGIAARAAPVMHSLQPACVAHLPLCSPCPEGGHFARCSVGLGEDYVQLHFVEWVGMRACSRKANLYWNIRLCSG